ncbi:hypothetical protein SAMN02745181_1257 [Rubritalea squalenifaciens DSM 18772]|uniref:PIN domain-containing protein n=1 Tax=Rubritalea squalenifaciens DSM 18772 TaxID=1123071 RepID=A0A1M6GST2_9BACT|nr:hypothetical protein [Rubritalea squalenifaciens]SHJ13018.1 hypothetical protein SAMN02745181_1257 [Rubritalea squalenifaciens DSM 18772]
MTLAINTVVVKDANIIIDLINGNLLEPWVELGLVTLTTDMVVSELKRGSQWNKISLLIASKAIVTQDIPATDIHHILALKRRFNVSIQDGSVLYLANSRGARLLTGDRKLRIAAKHSNIEVSGILWVLDLLVSTKQVTAKRAFEGLKLIIEHGARLPEDEVQTRLDRWG